MCVCHVLIKSYLLTYLLTYLVIDLMVIGVIRIARVETSSVSEKLMSSHFGRLSSAAMHHELLKVYRKGSNQVVGRHANVVNKM